MIHRIKRHNVSFSRISEIHSFLKELKVKLVTEVESLSLEDLINTLRTVNEIGIGLLEEKAKLSLNEDTELLEALTTVVELRKILLAKIGSLISAKGSIGMADLMTIVDLLNIINNNLKEAEEEAREWIRKVMNGINEPRPAVQVKLDLEGCLEVLKACEFTPSPSPSSAAPQPS